ncbi:MAG: hypothetical protein ACI9ON_002107 [Limisphaerales bacterium]|jgi:hypothetical protein
MSKSTPDISSLLAHRDGEPLDAAAEIDEAELEALNRVTDSLRSLPDVPISQAAWTAIQSSSQIGSQISPQIGKWRWQTYPMSTAASVLVLSAVVVLGLVRGFDEFATDQTLAHVDPSMSVASSASQIEPRLVAPRLVALRDRSQDLERQAYDVDGWRQSNSSAELPISPLGEFFLYQLTRVDEAIAQNAGQDSEQLTADLWQQRVNLLQAFLAEMEANNPGRFEDNRSM